MPKNLMRLAFFAMALMLILTACAPAATEAPVQTEPPAATEPPAVTELPAATESPATESPATEAPAEQFVFGMLLIGPYNDHGWSQAHYEAGQYVEEKLGAQLIYLDKVTPADR